MPELEWTAASSSRSAAAGKLLVGEPYFTPGRAARPRDEGRRRDLGRATSRSCGPGAAARGSSAGSAPRSRIENVLEALLVERARASSSSRTSRRSRASTAASTCATCRRITIDPDTAKDFDDALSFRREADGIRAWVHIADVSYFVPAGSPLDRGAAERAFSTYVPGPRRADAAARARRRRLLAAPAPGPALRHGRDAAARRAELLPLGDQLATRGSPTARPSGARRRRRSLEQLDLERRGRDGAARPRASRAARSRSQTPEVVFSFDATARVAERLARGRAARAHARRGADDPRERARRRVPRRPAAARRSTACTSGPTRRRSSCCSRSSPTSTCRRRPCPKRLSPQEAAELAGEISRRVTRVRRAVGARAGGVPGARPARAQAGALRPAQPRPLRAREHRVLPLHLADPPLSRPRRPPRAPARARPRRRSAARTTCTSSPSTPPRASARRRRSSTSPTTSASPGCSSDRLLERGLGASRGRARSPALIGSGLFVRFGEVFEGFLPARRLPGEFFELNQTGTALVGPHDRAPLPARRPDRGARRVDREERGQGRAGAARVTPPTKL